MYYIFIHSSVDGYVGWFHVLAIIDIAAVNTGMQVSFQTKIFSGYMPILLDHTVALILVF